MEWYKLGQTIKKNTMNTRNIISILLILFALGCSQNKLDFDKEKQALVSCDERIIIKNVRVMEAASYDVVYQLRLKEGFKGSNVVYLTGENEGYETGSNSTLELQPNMQYIITSVQGDSGLEMKVFTNSEAKIDSVLNKFSCSE